jgi:hypothetical protein
MAFPNQPQRGVTLLLRRVGLAVALLAVTGCTAPPPDLPAVGDATTPPPPTPAEVDLEITAQAMYDCARTAGVPVAYQVVDGRPIMVAFAADAKVIAVEADGTGWTSGDVSPEEFAAAQREQLRATPAATPQPNAPARLLIDGVDYTEAWTACLTASGYDAAASQAAAATGPTATTTLDLVVAASNRWAECARANGFPETQDAHLPNGPGETPMAVLPAWITDVQLRQLLEACPNFDPAVEAANAELWSNVTEEDLAELGYLGYPNGYQAQPVIGFDYPAFDGGDPAGTEPDPAVFRRLADLQDILNEARSAYNEAAV